MAGVKVGAKKISLSKQLVVSKEPITIEIKGAGDQFGRDSLYNSRANRSSIGPFLNQITTPTLINPSSRKLIYKAQVRCTF